MPGWTYGLAPLCGRNTGHGIKLTWRTFQIIMSTQFFAGTLSFINSLAESYIVELYIQSCLIADYVWSQAFLFEILKVIEVL